MGLVLDSGVLIAAERDARTVSELLASIEQACGETEIVLSAITVIELEHVSIARKRMSNFGSGECTWRVCLRRFR